MQAAQAADRICLAITLPKSKCDVSPKHGLNQVTSLPNLVTTGRNLGQIVQAGLAAAGTHFRLPEQPVPSRFRDPDRVLRGDETISADPRSSPETKTPYGVVHVTKGLDHVGIGPEPHLPRVSQARPSRHANTGRKAMTEVVTAILVFVSIGIFLAHAFDAYRLR